MHKYLILLFIFFPGLSYSQTITWDRVYNNEEADIAFSIKPTIDNGYIVAGNTSANIWILKLNEFGDTIWTKTYRNSTCNMAKSIIQTNEGNYVITGFKSPSLDYWDNNIYVLKLNETGNFIWDYEYPGGGNQIGYKIIETSDGGYLILGINYAFTLFEIVLIKLNENGQLIWDKKYDFQSISRMYEVVQTQDSGFILVGEQTNISNRDIWLMKTNQYGDTTWTKTINYQNDGIGYSIKQLEGGDFIMSATGGTDQYGYNQLLTYKLNVSGEVIWIRNFYNNASYIPANIITTNDGGFITSGTIWQQNGVRGIFVYKQNSSGDTIWTKSYHKGAYGGATEIHQTTDEGYIVSGYVSYNGSGSEADAWVLKLNESGCLKIPDRTEIISRNNVNLYPNPANQFVYCSFNTPIIINKTVKIKIHSLDGKILKGFSFPLNSQEQNNISLDVSNMDNGIYVVKFELGNEIVVKKIMILKK